jgi:hypothetical protein
LAAHRHGHPHITRQLLSRRPDVELLALLGDVDKLQRIADAGDHVAAYRLARLLVERGDATMLTQRADAGDEHAAARLAELLVERGDETVLTARADAGDEHAAAGWSGCSRGAQRPAVVIHCKDLVIPSRPAPTFLQMHAQMHCVDSR